MKRCFSMCEGGARAAVTLPRNHSERIAASRRVREPLVCFVAVRLAMTTHELNGIKN